MALQMSTFSFGPIALAAAPPLAFPSHTEFTLTSSGGPFCIVGFYIEPVATGVSRTSPAGTVEIALSRINGSGVIHPAIQIADGIGVSPRDLVVSYGSVMSSSRSIAFEVSQSPSSTGPGVPFRIFGNVIFTADETITLTVS